MEYRFYKVKNTIISLLLISVEVIFVNSASSAVNGGWSGWSIWSGCAAGICAGNQRIRTRTCTNPITSKDGKYCVGESSQQMDCMIDGGFTEWSQWSLCDNPCGGSVVNRTRTCANPTPSLDGKPCTGATVQTKMECVGPCPTGPLDGNWGSWTPWSTCPKTCGMSDGSILRRTRLCNQPPPMNGGKLCDGDDTETARSCFAPCPVDGGFSLWSTWTTCSQSCGTGSKSRSRLCNKPLPTNGGKNCTGDFIQAKSCKLTSCPGAVYGGWSAYSSWSACTDSKYCLQGMKKRTRKCTSPSPANGGDDCVGLAEEVKNCPTDKCTKYQPLKLEKTVADPKSWIYLECGATEKFFVNGSHKQNLPSGLFSSQNFGFIRAELESGYFAIQMLPDDNDEYGEKKITKICFEIIDPLTIEKIVTNKAAYYVKISALPGWTKPELNETIPGFTIWIDEAQALRKYEFLCAKSEKYVPYTEFVMQDVRFSYYTEGNFQTFKAKGDYYLKSGTLFKTEVKKSGGVYATGNADSANFGDMMASFGLDPHYLPEPFIKALTRVGIWNFTMAPAQLLRNLQRNGVFRFTASIDALGVPVHVEVLAGIRFARPTFAVGFSFDRGSFGRLAEKLSGIEVDFLDKFGVELEIGVSFHPPSGLGFQQLYVDSETKFSKEPLHSYIYTSVPQGIFAVAQVVLPKDCKGNKFCEIMKMIVGPTIKWYITGHFEWKKIRIATGFANVRIQDGLYFHKLELYVKADWNDTKVNTKIGFRADIKVPVKGEVFFDGIKAPESALFLVGGLAYDFTEQVVSGILGMRGFWRKAFSIDFLGIGNIYLGLTYQVGVPLPITGVKFGMGIEYGYDCLKPGDFTNEGHCFGGSGYFGVGQPQFFYAEMTAMTLGKIIRLLGFTFELPPPIAQSGFPEGAAGSYGESTVDLRITGGSFIPEGLMVRGKVNILGWTISAFAKLSDSSIKIDLKPDPIKILDLATIVKSPTEPEKGPSFFVEAKKDPIFFEAFIEGYIDLLGILAYCRLNLTMTHMELVIQGNFLGLIKAEVFVSSAFSLTFLGSKFYCKVSLDLNGLNNALDVAAEAVKSAFDEAQKKLADARSAVIKAKEDCKRKMVLKCDNCRKLKCAQAVVNCKGFLDKAGKWIGGVVDMAGNWIKGTIKNVDQALAPVANAIKKFFKGWKRKRAVHDMRNENFALHIRRRRFISKILCEGLVGGGCSSVSNLCEGSCHLGDHIGKGLCNVLDIAVGLLKLTETTCNWVSKAFKYVLTQLFRVYSIKFEFSLAAYALGGNSNLIFNAAFDLMIFGRRFYLATDFNLRDAIGSLKRGADKATEWYKEKMNKKGATDTEENYYDNANPYADFDMSEIFLIENQQSATDDRRGACFFVESKTDGALIKVTGCNDTDERQNWAYTMKGQIMNTWSQLCIDSNGGSKNSRLKQTKCDPRKDDQNFQCDLAVRSLMRKRSDQCWTLGKTSLNGPGSLVHLGSLKCIHPQGGGYNVAEGTKLLIHCGCSESRLEFVLQNSNLVHAKSGKCVRPMGEVLDGVALGLYSSCEGHQFSFTAGGSLQHVRSRKCVNTRSGKMKAANNEDMVLRSKCENSDTSLTKEHLLFSFVPTDPSVHLERCTHFDRARLDQRFEVMDEPAVSICSKFAKNLAYKKATEQSSTDKNGFSYRAVDENYSSHYEDKSCAQTKKEKNPWWAVDLGREYIVTDVMIVNRYNNFERLTNFDVKVGVSKNNTENPTCHDRVGTVGKGQALRVQCDPPIPGRYVSVQMFGEGILSLCEVAVYSRVGAFADLCQLNNGGCSQVCYNLCNLRVKCGCWPGYTLAYDGKTCTDRDECQINNGGCDTLNGLCINTLGSYHCQCKQGYQFRENSELICEDFNECHMNNAGCEQICSNSKGSFNCDCRAGFKLKADKMGCEDIDECASIDKGGCEYKCSNYEGGYYCTCPAGYRLMDDNKGCEEIYCPVLEVPFRGKVTPVICTDDRTNIRRNTVCSYGCETGHHLVGDDKVLICQIDGMWKGTVPFCKPVVCPKLALPEKAGVIPVSCSETDVEYGTECVFHCDDGFELKGPRYTTCKEDTSWSEIAPLSCVKVDTDPWIECPIDRVEDLDPDKSTVVLGYKWQLPRTNMKNVTVSPSNYDENYPFSVGKHRVTWMGASESGSQLSCSFYIIVNDVTPPSVQGCPASFTDVTDSHQKSVTWEEPIFTDNVGVVSVLSNRQPGFEMDTFTSINIRYTATDASDNEAFCTFNITVEGSTCMTINPPRNGTVTKMGWFLQLKCNPGYFFNPPPSGSFGLFQNHVYRCLGNKWVAQSDGVSVLTKAPDCVAHATSYGRSFCKEGSISIESICVNCPPGRYSDSHSNTCVECNPGFYQDQEGMTECQPCPKSYSHIITGSKSSDDCKPICRHGHYSVNHGMAPCVECPKGTYQNREQQTMCHACPVGSITTNVRSVSLSDCFSPLRIMMTIPDSDHVVNEETTITLACYIEGIPTPAITWTKVDEEIPSGRLKIRNLYDADAHLDGIEYYIHDAVVADSGTYECKATNKHESVSKQVRIEVLAKSSSGALP